MTIRFFSVDVETSGFTPATGRLLTVGIHVVRPTKYGGELMPDSLYVRMTRGVVKPDDSSMAWWAEQDEIVRNEAYADDTLVRHSPIVAARMICEFVANVCPEPEGRVFVANPVAFDKMWMTSLFDEARLIDPFHYRSLCLRSMKFGLNPGSEWGNDRSDHKPLIPHHALSDAHAQALDLCDMLNERSERTRPYEVTP